MPKDQNPSNQIDPTNEQRQRATIQVQESFLLLFLLTDAALSHVINVSIN